MAKNERCKKCEHADSLKGCAEKHVSKARRLISEGDIEGADLQLSYIKRHLNE